MDKISCSMCFHPKTIEVCWLWNVNLESHTCLPTRYVIHDHHVTKCVTSPYATSLVSIAHEALQTRVGGFHLPLVAPSPSLAPRASQCSSFKPHPPGSCISTLPCVDAPSPHSMQCEQLEAKGSVRSLYLWCDT